MSHLRLVVAAICISMVFAGCKTGTAGKVVTVAVAPASIKVVIGQSQQFTATVSDTFNTGVSWSVAGGSTNGTISSSGLYTAPASVPALAQVTITATSHEDPTKSGSAVVTVTATVVPNISVVVSPAAPSIPNFGTQQFGAAVTGTTNTAVTWEVNGTAGGSRTLGFISSAGFYVAPGNVPTAPGGNVTTLTVTAVSQADGSSSGSATVTIVPGNQNRQGLPIELGTSGGNVNDTSTSGQSVSCCGGTLGALVQTAGGTDYILSNNHVLARSDQGTIANGSSSGDAILEPALIDTNCSQTGTNTVAHLSLFYSLETGSAPKIDAALAQIVSGSVDTSGQILYLGATADSNNVPVAGSPHSGSGVAPSVGRAVAKSGRTTGLTCSTIGAIDASFSVDYQRGCGTGTTFSVSFSNQVSVMGGDFSAEGDSGSLIVTQDTADPLALLFAGSDTDTVGNPVGDVLKYFSTALGSTVTFTGGTTHQVIGCSLPNAPQSAAQILTVRTPSPETLQTSMAVRDAHSAELLGYPGVQAVGVGASYDNPAEPAIVFFMTSGQSHSGLPSAIDGIRTRVIEAPLFPHRGIISSQDSAANEQMAGPLQAVYPISDAEYQRAKAVHVAHVDELMRRPGVQGVGITSSVDAPGEAALMIFLIRGVAHDPIPAVIDGLRTRVRESSRFRAGYGGNEPRRSCPAAGAKIESSAQQKSQSKK